MIVPVFRRVIWSSERVAATLKAAQVALAAEAYRAGRGHYPDTIDELERMGWELPADPFGGGEYRYRREGRGFVVWSIGPDMDDDGAARDYYAWRELPDGQRQTYDYDVVFRCER